MSNNSKNDQRVVLDKFITTMQLVYSSTLEDKMQLVFNIFDFDCDGKISAEDVKLVLSYIPSRKLNSSLSVDDSSNEREKPQPTQEGLYNRSEGKDMGEEERGSNQKQIKQFVTMVFSNDRKFLNLKDFIEFNKSVSSEMFISVISVIQERLPCS
jgi:Ca2+-binding EF-hand superfamily protein